jgi:hypothetical protein
VRELVEAGREREESKQGIEEAENKQWRFRATATTHSSSSRAKRRCCSGIAACATRALTGSSLSASSASSRPAVPALTMPNEKFPTVHLSLPVARERFFSIRFRGVLAWGGPNPIMFASLRFFPVRDVGVCAVCDRGLLGGKLSYEEGWNCILLSCSEPLALWMNVPDPTTLSVLSLLKHYAREG